MEQIETFGDDRHLLYCLYCGASPDSREHVPSKVLLDKPYPENLPVVGACRSCNTGFSRDEDYVACAIAVALAGSAEPDQIGRPRIRRLLRDRPALAARLAAGLTRSDDGTTLAIEPERVRKVVTKLARGHVFFELSEPAVEEPINVAFAPLPLLSADARRQFETPPASAVWPPPGSRALIQLVERWPASDQRWTVVQDVRYRYAVSPGPVFVRIVLSEYLACEVAWE